MKWKEFISGYEVSDYGEVRNKVTKSKIKPHISKGYVRVRIRHRKFSSLLHRLVLMTFDSIPNHDQCVVNHIDGNPFNNNLNNLQWCSQEENLKHSKQITKNGTVVSRKKILKLYEDNKEIPLSDFINLLIQNCK